MSKIANIVEVDMSERLVLIIQTYPLLSVSTIIDAIANVNLLIITKSTADKSGAQFEAPPNEVSKFGTY